MQFNVHVIKHHVEHGAGTTDLLFHYYTVQIQNSVLNDLLKIAKIVTQIYVYSINIQWYSTLKEGLTRWAAHCICYCTFDVIISITTHPHWAR